MLQTSVDQRAREGREAPRTWQGILIAALGLAGCGNELPRSLPPQAPLEGAKVATNDPSGGFFAGVSMRGSGCSPEGVIASVSEDGQAFGIAFSEYETEVRPDLPLVSTKNCTLSFKLESPKGLTFAVPEIVYQGSAYLEQGVTLTHTVSYGFRGTGLTIPGGSTTLTGFYDDNFLMRQPGGDRVWAACGTRTVIHVNTQLRMQNTTPPGFGLANFSSVDGESKILMRLAFRPCQAPAVRDAGVAPASTADTARSAPIAEEVETWRVPTVVKSIE